MALDLSLRHARTIYRTLAVVLLPLAFTGVIWVFSGVVSFWEGLVSDAPTNNPGLGLLQLLLGAIFIGAEWSVIAQSVEATRRLRTLRENPEKRVRRMTAPFQSSLFGPYH